ncbi:MAG: tetratricopeptide repeat-containing protein [Candidatus Rokuibacteriota bacterium]
MAARPHAFVAMPFGTKPGPKDPASTDREAKAPLIDFNRVYAEYIEPALRSAGFESFRADQEVRAGDIRTDMFQELLVADLVIADLTIDNPNVWYELGVRHALRARGVVIICGGNVTTAFDLYTDRKLRYALKDGAPDPAQLEEDKRKLVEMVNATMESWHGRKVSPVYNLIPNLQEPDWKSLRIGDAREFWEAHEAWEQRIELARKAGRVGDLLVLANEAPIAAFRAEAWIKAGEALRRAERYEFALEHLEHGLESDPHNIRVLREIGICLQRLALAGVAGHSIDRARQHYRNAVALFPRDAETWALLGRVDKDAWVAAWDRPGLTPEQKRTEAAYEDALLTAAVDSYTTAYRANPGHYYSGINALTLMHLHRHLTGDPRYDPEMEIMAGAVRFAIGCESDDRQIPWSKMTLGDLEVLVGTAAAVTKAYKEAIAKNDKDWFALNSSRAQLQLLKNLGLRPEAVDAGIAAFDRALEKLRKPEDRWQPRQVLLYSGHMVDAPNRPGPPRFPAEREDTAAAKIAGALDQLGAGSDDLALCQAAAGGDLLFLEACQKRGVRCQVLLPLPEPEFIERSILPSKGGVAWRDRFFKIRDQLKDPIRIMPVELGPLPNGVDPFERCNLWLLYTTLAWGLDRVRFVCLWNGGGGDGPGGTAHMYNEVKQRTGRVTWIDTREAW